MKERERKRPPFFLSQNGSQPKIEWGMNVNKERERERERGLRFLRHVKYE